MASGICPPSPWSPVIHYICHNVASWIKMGLVCRGEMWSCLGGVNLSCCLTICEPIGWWSFSLFSNFSILRAPTAIPLPAIDFKGGLEFDLEPSPLHKTGKEDSNSSLASGGISLLWDLHWQVRGGWAVKIPWVSGVWN